MSFTVIIPARFSSTRLPGKPLLDIVGMPMIIRVLKQAQESGAQQIIVATDDIRIAEQVEKYGGEACLTRGDHQSGTERISEVIEKHKIVPNEIIVNVQGDEPLIPPSIIRQVASNIEKSGLGMATLAVPIHDAEEIKNPNVVKVVVNKFNQAIYFSRAPIPWDRDNVLNEETISFNNIYLRHLGIYAYRASFVKWYLELAASPIEQIEKLEQLRVLWYGEKIHVDVALEVPEVGVDTAEDLERVRKIFMLNKT